MKDSSSSLSSRRVHQQATDLRVHVVDEAEVAGAAVVHRVVVEAQLLAPGHPALGIEAFLRLRELRRPIADGRLAEVAAGVAVVVELGRGEGRVGVNERHVEEEGHRGVALGQEFNGLGDAPEGVRLLFRYVVGPRLPAVGGDTVGHRPALDGHSAAEPVEVVVVLAARAVGDEHVMEAEPLAVGPEVQLADHLALIAGGGQLAGEGCVRLPVHATGHADHAVRRGRLAGHDRAPGGDAARRLGIAVSKEGAGVRQVVEIGRIEDGMTVEAQAVAALLVGHDE